MAKCIYVCKRHSEQSHVEEKNISEICNAIQPDNLETANHKVFSDGVSSFGIMNFVPSIQIKNQSVLLGFMYEERESWDEIGSDFPDGSYAMFRNSESSFEAVSDILATRTIWYYHDEEQFIASTSQRAIVMYLGSFEFDDRIVSWMLSTGTIGPDFSWDKRIKKLTPDSSVQLDKENWSLIINENSFKIESKQLSYEKHKKDLLNAIQNTLRSLLNLDFSRWPITLSGGYDSRAILCKLKQLGPNNQFIALTHGSEGSLDTIGSDANIARQLTEKLNIQHKFHKIEKTSISIKKVIDRFIKQSDGTTDHITAYMDGMDMWKNFVEKEKFFGIIRGDVVFHPQKIKTPLQARKMVGLLLCSDFSNLNKLANDFNLPDQVLPVSLRKNKNESVTDWREKIYQRFRVPTIHSALSSIKLSYVEMINPLLSKRVVKQVNSMPDSFRKDKSIFKDIVESLSPDVPYTSAPSLSKQDVISTPDFLHVITNKLNDSYSRHLLGSVFIDQVLSKVKQRKKAVPAKKVKSKKIKVSSLLLYITPKFIHKIYQKYKSKPDLNPNILAFRIFIIVRTHELFNEESKVQRQYKDLKLKR